jgi:hypothetical protein
MSHIFFQILSMQSLSLKTLDRSSLLNHAWGVETLRRDVGCSEDGVRGTGLDIWFI